MIQELLSLADQRGYLTLDDILETLEDDGDDSLIETTLSELYDLGIELRHDNEEFVSSFNFAPDYGPDETIHIDSDNFNDSLPAIPGDPDPIGLYFRQMAQEPLLSALEEIELAKRIERGKQAQKRLARANGHLKNKNWIRQIEQWVEDGQLAREHLGRANTRLVVSIAKRYMNQGLPFSDLIQEGNVGLMRAVDKFDYRRGNRFSTYATWWIRQAITRALAQKTRTIRIPLHMTERIRQMYRTAQDLEQTMGRRPTTEEIAKVMGVSTEIIRIMMDASQHAIALERPVGDEGDSEFGDFLEDRETANPLETATQRLLEETIEEVLAELTPRQSHILRLRFGLGGSETHTLEEIANKFGLSRERIRQLEKEALRRLRHPQLAVCLHDYLL